MVVIQRKDDEKIENLLQSLDDELQELKAKMSSLRKKGKNTEMAEMLTLDFAPKLKMARVTYESEDIEKIKNLLQEIRDELKESEEGSDFSHATDLIKEAYEYIRNDKLKEASAVYSAITKIYGTLPKDLKKTVYLACLDIKKKIDPSGIKKRTIKLE